MEQTTFQLESNTSKALAGLALFGQVLSGSSKEAAAASVAILKETHKDWLMAAFYTQTHGKVPPPEVDYMNDPQTVWMYGLAVNQVRSFIQGVLDEAATISWRKKQEDLRLLQERPRHSNDKHPAGSVAEIAAKLGCSKNEVRRWKADGVLDQKLRDAGVIA
jgi:hypothetical protein